MHDDPRPPLEPVPPASGGEPPPLPLPAPAPLRAPAEGRSRLALVALLALLAGLAGGFAGGRMGGRAESATATGEVAAPTDSDNRGRSSATAVGVIGSTDGSSEPVVDDQPPKVTRLFKRAVPGGELRVWRIEDLGGGCRGNGCPPPECFPIGFVQAMIIGDWDVSQGGTALWAGSVDGARLTGFVGPSGQSSDDPVPLGFLLRTGENVRTVRWVAKDGTLRDQMASQDGLAIVVTTARVDVRSGPFPVDGSRIEALDAAGKVRTTIELDDRDALMRAFAGAPPAACDGSGSEDEPQVAVATTIAPSGPALPAPGEQPADRAAAEAAVRAMFAVALGNTADPAAANAAIDDPEGLQAARDASNRQFPQYAGKVRFEMTGLVFVSPTRAAFTYTVTETDKGQVLANQVGNARLVEGRWLITRATVCNLLPVKPSGSC